MSDDTSKKAPEQRDLKVTDKRMFTPDGELREEYRDVGTKSQAESAAGGGAERGPGAGPGGPTLVGAGEPGAPGTAAPPAGGAGGAGSPGAPSPDPGSPGAASPGGGATAGVAPGPGGDPMDLPDTGAGPAFLDLVALLAEPVALYLGDAQTADGQSHENLDAARLHIDLLDVLREKTAGNLSAQESGILEDVLYRLRMRYVQKQG